MKLTVEYRPQGDSWLVWDEWDQRGSGPTLRAAFDDWLGHMDVFQTKIKELDLQDVPIKMRGLLRGTLR